MIQTINCRDCGEPTWNRTERCCPCKRTWRKKVAETKESAKKDLEKAIRCIQKHIDKELTEDKNNG